jgi:hypothetical protein
MTNIIGNLATLSFFTLLIVFSGCNDRDTGNLSKISNQRMDTMQVEKKCIRMKRWGYETDNNYSFDYLKKYWDTLENQVNKFSFTENCVKEIESTDFIECEFTITSLGIIENPKVKFKVSRETQDELLSLINSFPKLGPYIDEGGNTKEIQCILQLSGCAKK